MKIALKLLLLPLCGFAVLLSAADDGWTVYKIYGDNMVLQHGRPIRVSGSARPGQTVQVTLGKQTSEVRTGDDGEWRSELPPMPPGGPHEIFIRCGDDIRKLSNVLIGEVWICSGQSNMEVRLREVNHAEREIAAMNHPQIRLFHGNVYWANAEPRKDFARNPFWSECTSATARDFSAVACFFAERLNRELQIPVGVVSVNWGGSRIEPWISLYGFEQTPSLRKEYRSVMAKKPGSEINRQMVAEALRRQQEWLEKARRDAASGKLPPKPPAYPEELAPYVMQGTGYHQKPTLVFNAMIAPLLTASFRGLLWYQGESNYQDGMAYRDKMAALMKSFRHEFRHPEMPIYFAQLTPYLYRGTGFELPELQAAQQAYADSDRYAHMAVLTDLGELRNIHPRNKREVGIRLANLALQYEYGKSICAEFPYYATHRREGSSLMVKFRNVKALRTIDGKAPSHFEISGNDRVFHTAQARIDGIHVVLSSPAVPEPEHVRFGWHQSAQPNLRGENQLPAGPFNHGPVRANQ